MNIHADKTQENKSHTVASSLPKLQSNSESTFHFADNRLEAIAQRKLQETTNNSPCVQQLSAYQEMANNSPQVKQSRALQGKFEPIQKKENNTGLPDNLKSGIENLSGFSMDDVKVHYNSDKPAQLQAHAYAQGSEIHLASGQEKHLPHEAWHVVQQKQGRVKPTVQLKGKVNINDDVRLEKEADEMGRNALQGDRADSITSGLAIQKMNKAGKQAAIPIQRLEKKRVAMVHGGRNEDVWTPHDVDFDRLNASGARVILKNIKMGEMRGSEIEVARLQGILSTAIHRELLTWEDMQWASQNGVVFRFNTNKGTLTQENAQGLLKGHQYAIYDISSMIEEMERKLSREVLEPEQVIHEIIREFQQRIIKMSVSSVQHAIESQSGTYVVAQSKLPTKDLNDKLMPWSNQFSWLADGSALEIKASDIKTVDTKILSFDEFSKSVASITDGVMNYIKSRGGTRVAKIEHSSSEIRNEAIDDELLPGVAASASHRSPVEERGIFTKYADGKWYTADGTQYEYREDKDGYCWKNNEEELYVDKEGEPDLR